MRIAPTARYTQPVFGLLHEATNLASQGARRTRIGGLVEEVTLGLLALAPCASPGGECVTFDGVRGDIHYEVKSVKRGSQVVVYKWRLEREAATGVPIRYVIAIRSHAFGHCENLAEVRGLLAEDLLTLVVLGHDRVTHLCEGEPLHKLTRGHACGSTRVGYARKGYSEGYYLLPTASLLEGTTLMGTTDYEEWGTRFRAVVRG